MRRLMLLTESLIKENCADLEKAYVDYLVHHFADWNVWAEASQSVADRKPVNEEEIPEAFRIEFKITQVIVEMETLGKFDWQNPTLLKLFGELAQGSFYKFFGDTITKIALRLAERAHVNTLLEIGAGRANLTSIMLNQMAQMNLSFPLVTTDSQPIVLENLAALKSQCPQTQLQAHLWNITEPPSEELRDVIKPPTLLYERYTMNYANVSAIKNIAQVADILVLGDWFNVTGELFAYDEVFKKIGAMPFFYQDIKPYLDEYFPNQHIFDQRAIDAIKLPNITLLIAWK
jgi:hypothetical protein